VERSKKKDPEMAFHFTQLDVGV